MKSKTATSRGNNQRQRHVLYKLVPPKNKPNHYFYFRCYCNKIIIIIILFYGLIPAAVQCLLRTRAHCKWNGLHSPPIICEVLKGHFHLTFELCVSANEVGGEYITWHNEMQTVPPHEIQKNLYPSHPPTHAESKPALLKSAHTSAAESEESKYK